MVTDESIVYVKGHEVVGQIDGLGLTVEIVRGAVDEGIRPRLACTANDPDYLLGMLGSGKISRALRDRIVRKPYDWTRQKHRNQPSTVRPDGNVTIIVAGGTEGTGIENGCPATRSAKGEATKDAIRKNQLSFFPPGSFAVLTPTCPNDQTWIFLHFIDREAGEVRCELSLPQFMDEENHVSEWRQRIILPPIPIDGEPIVVGSEDEADDGLYIAPVEPRAS